MRKMLTVALREYKAVVRTKSFLVSLLLMPIMMGGSVIFQMLFKDTTDTKDKRIAVIDRTPAAGLFAPLKAAADERNEKANTDKKKQAGYLLEMVSVPVDGPDSLNQLRLELCDRVRQKDLFGILEIGPDVLAPPNSAAGAPERRAIRYQTNSPLNQSFPRWAEKVLNDAIETRRAAQAGMTSEQLKIVQEPVPLLAKGLTSRNRQTGAIDDGRDVNFLASFFAPFGLVILMFMVIMVGATPLMQGVVEEKMQRIAEVLLGSIQPFDLMMGKLLGSVGISFTLVGVYLSGAVWAAYHFGYAEYVSLEVLVWFLAYQVLAVLMFGSMFIAIGAAAADIKETQTMLMPVMLLACLPLFALVNVITEPEGPLATWLSFFPPATPMLMTVRMAVPPGIPLWQPIVGVALVLATTILCVWAAGRIFRVGILMQGKGANFADMFRWVLRA